MNHENLLIVRGHGTYVDEHKTLRSSVAGVLEKVNKLISIKPFKTRYQGEIGDVVVGRITEVQQKRWKVDTNAKLDSALLLSSVNLPGGELVSFVIKNKIEKEGNFIEFFFFDSEEDQLKMNK